MSSTNTIKYVNTYDIIHDVRQNQKKIEFHLTRYSDQSSGWAGLGCFEGKATHRLIVKYVSDPLNKEKYELMRRRAQDFSSGGASTSGGSFDIADVKAVRHFQGTIEFRVVWKQGKTTDWVAVEDMGGLMNNWYIVEFLKNSKNKSLFNKAKEEQKEFLRRTTAAPLQNNGIQKADDDEMKDEEDEKEEEEENEDDEEEDEEEEETEEEEDEEDDDDDDDEDDNDEDDSEEDNSKKPFFILQEVTDVRYDARIKKLLFYAVYQGYSHEEGQWQTVNNITEGLGNYCILKFKKENAAAYKKALDAYNKGRSNNKEDRAYKPHHKRPSPASARRSSRRHQALPTPPRTQSPPNNPSAQSPPNSPPRLLPPTSPARKSAPNPPTRKSAANPPARKSAPPPSARQAAPVSPPKQSPPNSPPTQSPLPSPQAMSPSPSLSTKTLAPSSSSQAHPSSSLSSLPPAASNPRLPRSRSQATQSAPLPCSSPTDENPLPKSLQDVLHEKKKPFKGIVVADTSSDEDEAGPSQVKRRKISSIRHQITRSATFNAAHQTNPSNGVHDQQQDTSSQPSSSRNDSSADIDSHAQKGTSSSSESSKSSSQKLAKKTSVDYASDDRIEEEPGTSASRDNENPASNLVPSSSTSPQADRFDQDAILESTGTQTDHQCCSPEPKPSNGEVSENVQRRKCLKAIQLKKWKELEGLILDGVKLTGELPNGQTIMEAVLENEQLKALQLMLERGFDMREVDEERIFVEGKWITTHLRNKLHNKIEEAMEGVSEEFDVFKAKPFVTFPLYRMGNDRAQFSTTLREVFGDWKEGEAIGLRCFTGFFDRKKQDFVVSTRMLNKTILSLDEDELETADRHHSLFVVTAEPGRKIHKISIKMAKMSETNRFLVIVPFLYKYNCFE